MKQREMINQLRQSSLADLQKSITDIETKLQAQKMAVAFGKSKEVSTVRTLKRQLAQHLTIARQKMASAQTEGDK
jgi:ribosomal protein L29